MSLKVSVRNAQQILIVLSKRVISISIYFRYGGGGGGILAILNYV